MKITLDGRKFTGMQALAANQDDYILAHVRLAGAIEVLHDLDGKERTNEKRRQDLLTQILLSGRVHHILSRLSHGRGQDVEPCRGRRECGALRGNIRMTGSGL
jgi:ABC-type nitrate/sulfonate/bicarbonate transport system ATPase subunit